MSNTLIVGQAIVGYMQALTYPGGSQQVYKVVTLGEQKDITDNVANGAVSIEIYANLDSSEHFAFNGKIRDTQSWFLLSLVNMDDAQAAEALIYQVRDALIVPFQEHATLGGTGTVFNSQLKPNSGKFLKVFRNAQWYRAHLIEIQTKSEWVVPTPPGVIS